MQRIFGAYAIVILAASVYFGFANSSDIVNTATIPQKLVGITATAYAFAGLGVFEGIRRSARWLHSLVLVWATLVVTAALLATIVYAQNASVTANPAITGACVLIVAPVVRWSRGRAAHSVT